MIASVYFLFVAVSCLFLYVAPFFWPLILISQLGTLLTLYHKRGGFYLSLATLLLYTVFDYNNLACHPFMFCFLGAVVLSFCIEYLRQQDVDLEKRTIEELKERLSEEKKRGHEKDLDWERLCLQQSQLEEEREIALSEIASYKKKILELEIAYLEQERRVSAHSEASEVLSPTAEYLLLEQSHTQLQKQFREKSEVLSELRGEYFALETRLFTLEKERAAAKVSESLDLTYLCRALYELNKKYLDLEEENLLLEEMVSGALFSSPRKKIVPVLRKKDPKMTLDLLEHLESAP